MMHIVCSYGTFETVRSGAKTCTRRRWKDSHAAKFHEGDVVKVLDRGYRAGLPVQTQLVRLTCDPYQERLADMPAEDLAAEGGLWPDKETFIGFFGEAGEIVWVVWWQRIGESRAKAYKTAKSIIPWKPGDELPEAVIRRGRDYVRGGSAGDDST